jgi:2-dehydro-3-deoxygluconokinase
MMFMNQKEYDIWADNTTDDEETGLFELEEFFNSNIIIKRGALGCRRLVKGVITDIRGHEVQVRDTCGAGDAFMAAYVSSGLNEATSLSEANKYAAFNCTIEGTRVPMRHEYNTFLKEGL